MMQPPTTARLIEHTYSSTGRIFWTVQCDECGSVLNSGHHYTGDDGKRFAEAMAEDHNRERHPQPAAYTVKPGEVDDIYADQDAWTWGTGRDIGCA